MKISKDYYKKIIYEDIEWLKKNTCDCLEQKHIIIVLENSIQRIFNNNNEVEL